MLSVCPAGDLHMRRRSLGMHAEGASSTHAKHEARGRTHCTGHNRVFGCIAAMHNVCGWPACGKPHRRGALWHGRSSHVCRCVVQIESAHALVVLPHPLSALPLIRIAAGRRLCGRNGCGGASSICGRRCIGERRGGGGSDGIADGHCSPERAALCSCSCVAGRLLRASGRRRRAWCL